MGLFSFLGDKVKGMLGGKHGEGEEHGEHDPVERAATAAEGGAVVAEMAENPFGHILGPLASSLNITAALREGDKEGEGKSKKQKAKDKQVMRDMESGDMDALKASIDQMEDEPEKKPDNGGQEIVDAQARGDTEAVQRLLRQGKQDPESMGKQARGWLSGLAGPFSPLVGLLNLGAEGVNKLTHGSLDKGLGKGLSGLDWAAAKLFGGVKSEDPAEQVAEGDRDARGGGGPGPGPADVGVRKPAGPRDDPPDTGPAGSRGVRRARARRDEAGLHARRLTRYHRAMHSTTALAAGTVGLLIALLGTAVSLTRIAKRASGPGFERLQRAHGNAVEHVPLMLVLLFLAEELAAPRALLLAAATTLIVARFAHAAGMLIRRRHPLQFFGATLTYIVEAGLAVLVMVLGL
jgi:uncharacterized membrane protein YecN with MAPEG domain